MAGYQVRLASFEGPLDLLLSLIERRELDITTISLALVTDQFLEYLRSGAAITSEVLADFVVVAAKLLLIKSVALLPRPARDQVPNANAIEDPTDLTQRLREYRAFREAGAYLRQRQDDGLHSHQRVPIAVAGPQGARPKGDVVKMPVETLRAALLRVLQVRPAEEAPRELPGVEWTVAEATDWLLSALLRGKVVRFQELVMGESRPRVIAAFLALLELHRLGRVLPLQEQPFGEIELRAVEAPVDGAFTSFTPSFTSSLTAGY